MATTLVALYDDFETASDAIDELRDAGFSTDTISLITNDASGEYARYVRDMDADYDDDDVDAGEGALAGGIVGGLIGMGVALIPGVGLVLAAGPIAALIAGGLTGAAAGAVTGGVVGALVDLDMSKEEAGYYAEGVRRGGTLVVVNAATDTLAERAENILDDHDPVDIQERTRLWHESGWTGYDRNAEPYTVEAIERERTTYPAKRADRVETVRGVHRANHDWNYDEFDVYEPEFRTHYDTYYAGSGYDYDLYRPAYYYGYTLATSPYYRNYDWVTLEPEARRRWEQQNDSAWDDVKNAVREGWQRIRQAV